MTKGVKDSNSNAQHGVEPALTHESHHEQDLKLVKGVLENRREAFEAFFDVYFSRLYRFCSARVSDPHLCEDIVQETLLKSMRKMATYRGEASLFTWLCQIARNEISDYFRRYGRKDAPLVSLDDDPQVRAALELVAQQYRA